MQVSLILLSGNGKQKKFDLSSELTVLGRRKDCDLYIPLESVSRRHCELDIEGDSLIIRDLKSKNGTFLNGSKIQDQTTAKHGDKLVVGPLSFILQFDGKPVNSADSANLSESTGLSDDSSLSGIDDLAGGSSLGDLPGESELDVNLDEDIKK